jgi:hypothetical protein
MAASPQEVMEFIRVQSAAAEDGSEMEIGAAFNDEELTVP